jgi:hypothetical protein
MTIDWQKDYHIFPSTYIARLTGTGLVPVMKTTKPRPNGRGISLRL